MKDALNPMFFSQTNAGKFGRPLGDVVSSDMKSLVTYLIENNYGVPYMGQAKADIQKLHDHNYKVLHDRGEI